MTFATDIHGLQLYLQVQAVNMKCLCNITVQPQVHDLKPELGQGKDGEWVRDNGERLLVDSELHTATVHNPFHSNKCF